MICQWYTMIYHDIISTLQISRVEGYEPTGGFGGLRTTYLFGTYRWSRVPSSNSSQSQRQWHHSNIMFGILMRKCNHVAKITTDLGGYPMFRQSYFLECLAMASPTWWCTVFSCHFLELWIEMNSGAKCACNEGLVNVVFPWLCCILPCAWMRDDMWH